MAYFVSETVPITTLPTNPHIYSLNIAPIVIDKVDILFPRGCVYLCGVRIKYRSIQIFPYNDNEWFIGNGSSVIFNTEYQCFEPPFVIDIEYFNIDDFYTHRPAILLDVTFVDKDNIPISVNRSMDINTNFREFVGVR